MTDQTNMPELLPCPFCGGDPEYAGFGDNTYMRCAVCGCMTEDFSEARAVATWNRRADLAAEQVREAYERGLEDAARVAEVKPRKGGRPLSGPHHAGIRRGRSEAACLIRALKSNDTNGGHQ